MLHIQAIALHNYSEVIMSVFLNFAVIFNHDVPRSCARTDAILIEAAKQSSRFLHVS